MAHHNEERHPSTDERIEVAGPTGPHQFPRPHLVHDNHVHLGASERNATEREPCRVHPETLLLGPSLPRLTTAEGETVARGKVQEIKRETRPVAEGARRQDATDLEARSSKTLDGLRGERGLPRPPFAGEDDNPAPFWVGGESVHQGVQPGKHRRESCSRPPHEVPAGGYARDDFGERGERCLGGAQQRSRSVTLERGPQAWMRQLDIDRREARGHEDRPQHHCGADGDCQAQRLP